jgi:molybdopterin biosynthesis enzyme
MPSPEIAVTGSAFSHPAGRSDFVLSRVCSRSADGQPVIEPIPRSGSASLGALLKADGVMEAPPTIPDLPAGTHVAFHRFDRLFHCSGGPAACG